MKKPRTVNYINNKHLLEEMKLFIAARKEAVDAGRETPQISKYIGESIMSIANKLARKGNFSGYSFREEMISDGIENCIMYLHNFNTEKSNNPFAYITRIIWQAYVRRIEKEGKHSYIRHKMMAGSSIFNELGEMDTADRTAVNSIMEHAGNDKSSEIISKFENKLADKKRKKADKLLIDAETAANGGQVE